MSKKKKKKKKSVFCESFSHTVYCDSHDSGGQCSPLEADSKAQAKQPHKQCLQTTLALNNDIKMTKT